MQDNPVIPFPPPQLTAEDPLTAVLRPGAPRLLAQAIEVEVAMLLARYADHRDNEGRQAIVRNGYLPDGTSKRGLAPSGSKCRRYLFMLTVTVVPSTVRPIKFPLPSGKSLHADGSDVVRY